MPFNSPDMNVIEDLFPVLKKVNDLPPHWSLKRQVQYAMEYKIESDFIMKLIETMPKRLGKGTKEQRIIISILLLV